MVSLFLFVCLSVSIILSLPASIELSMCMSLSCLHRSFSTLYLYFGPSLFLSATLAVFLPSPPSHFSLSLSPFSPLPSLSLFFLSFSLSFFSLCPYLFPLSRLYLSASCCHTCTHTPPHTHTPTHTHAQTHTRVDTKRSSQKTGFVNYRDCSVLLFSGNFATESDDLLWNVVAILHTFNHSCNFFLYMISGRQFRKWFSEAVCQCLGRQDSDNTTLQRISTVSREG